MPHYTKASPGFQYIANIITVAGSANVDADPKFLDPHNDTLSDFLNDRTSGENT